MIVVITFQKSEWKKSPEAKSKDKRITGENIFNTYHNGLISVVFKNKKNTGAL